MKKTLSGERLEKELLRLDAMKEFERRYQDYAFLCGIDEAGRGPCRTGDSRGCHFTEGLHNPLSE